MENTFEPVQFFDDRMLEKKCYFWDGKVPDNKRFWRNLRNIENTLKLGVDTWAQLWGISPRSFLTCQHQNKLPTLTQVIKISSFFSLVPENLFWGLDLQALSQHFKGNLSFLPSRYLKGSTSKVRTLFNILGSLPLKDKNWMMSYLQLTDQALFATDVISVLAISDALNLIQGNKFGTIRNIGFENVFSRLSDELATDLRRSKSIGQIYEKVDAICFGKIEQNWNYKLLKNKDGQTRFKISPYKETLELVGEFYGGSCFLAMQLGFGEAIPQIFGPHHVQSKIIKRSEQTTIVEFLYTNSKRH